MIISQLPVDFQKKLDVVFIFVEHFDDEKASPSSSVIKLNHLQMIIPTSSGLMYVMYVILHSFIDLVSAV